MHESQYYRIKHLVRATLILLLAALLSVLALHHARRWHPDEAFYMTIARNAAVQGDWMLVSEPLDKPPLTYYNNALSLVLLAVDADTNGVLFLDMYKGEFAGRMPSLLLSVLLVAVVISLAKTLHHDSHVSVFAGLLVALSPLRIVFAPTAFTDMPMLLFATLALWMAARGRWSWAGVWFALSLAAKPQSVFYLPLIVSLMWQQKGLTRQALMQFMTPLIAAMGLLWLWDMARVTQGATSFWVLGQARYTPTLITPLSDYPARIAALWATVQYLFGHGILTAILLLMGAYSAVHSRRVIDLMLLWWLVGFFALHLILTLNLFDRNLILLVPVASVLIVGNIRGFSTSKVGAARCAPTITSYLLSKKSIRQVANIVLLLCLIIFALLAARGSYSIGGDDGRYDGIDQLADYLNSKPVATVIYDRWFDWELDYYMGVWTNKRRVYYPTPEALREGAQALHESGIRFLVAPATEDVSDWLMTLTQAGFRVSLDYESKNFRAYALQPPR